MGLGMMSEYFLGDEDYGGGLSGETGCGFFILIGAGAGFGVLLACKYGVCLFSTVICFI